MATSALSLARTRRLKNRGVQRWDAQRQGPSPSRPTAGPPCPAPPSDGAARASTTLSTGTGHARLVLLTELSTGMTAPFKQMRTHRRFVVRAWTIPSWPVMGAQGRVADMGAQGGLLVRRGPHPVMLVGTSPMVLSNPQLDIPGGAPSRSRRKNRLTRRGSEVLEP